MEPWGDRVAVVTGGGGGIGRAIAGRIVEAGGSVIIGDLNRDRGVEAVRGLGDRARFVPVDVADESDVEALMTAAVDSFGRLDALFNNAAIGGAFGPIVEQTVEAWDTTFAVNVRSVFLGTKHAARLMIEQGDGGAIVNTASVAGQSGGGGPQAYSATKAAVINLTQTTAAELAPHHIRVNAVCPGAIYTELMHRGRPEMADEWREEIQPWPERGEPEMIADVAMWLASDAARFVTGASVTADGGLMAAAPRLVDLDLAHLRRMTGIAYGNTGQEPEVRRL
ncbi:MAG: glucose 1-dehydrogenase [Ilumatobacter sp.]|uniref:SDR family NAD(P)-dependent oxidoreductase n=1 Tax=Ilumatobacter sp. TaxID=1967498 RepID=UPI002610844D|nr:glucose 1-dehydrogenase [Ilumatobacter sp.]MDJ0769173.1 glucose 1-dehydrogenase [Ilumatobacter sp.]